MFIDTYEFCMWILKNMSNKRNIVDNYLTKKISVMTIELMEHMTPAVKGYNVEENAVITDEKPPC